MFRLMHRLWRLFPVGALILSVIFSLPALAQEPAEGNAAAEENAEDDDDKSGGGNFLVLPVFITEPAIGEGLGLGLVYFHKDRDPDMSPISTPSELGKTGKRPNPPPTATGLFAFKTSNGTQGFGAGHTGTYLNDSLRVVGALASMEVKTTTYLGDTPFDFDLDGELAYLSIKRQVGASRWFLGASVSYLDGLVDFDVGALPLPPELFNFSLRDIGLAGIAIYDSRDDTMMPGSGILIDNALWYHDESLGGDFNYLTYRLKVHWFRPLHERFVLGLRGDVWTSGGRPPFFAEPFVSLRGIPALRYQGETAGVFEMEGRYNISPRWAAVVFGGVGFTKTGDLGIDTEQDINAYGAGIRFQALKQQNVWLGIDVAQGPEEIAWYFQMGHAW
jgi:hypothetical protein